MSQMMKGWMLVATLLGTTAYALAEDVVFFGSYNSPRGSYDQLIATEKLLIGATSAPDPSALLELAPDANAPKGFLPPRVSNPNQIQNAADGLFVYNTTTSTYDFFQGGAVQTWKSMGTSKFWTSPNNGVDLSNANVGGNVGIGVASPAAELQVANGAVWFDGVRGGTPTSGAGTRLMWIPAKGAFRAGESGSNFPYYWDDTFVGPYSVSFGISSWVGGDPSSVGGTASMGAGVLSHARGNVSLSLGFTNDAGAIADMSTAIGSGIGGCYRVSTAIGLSVGAQEFSTAFGYNTFAGGKASVAMGDSSSTNQDYSVAIGHQASSNALSAFALGHGIGNSTHDSLAMGFVSTGSTASPALFVGSGAFNTTGPVGIGTATPTQALEVSGGTRLNTTAAKPLCTTAVLSGTMWFTQNPGAKDVLEVCASNSGGSYAWRTIY